MKRKVIEGIGRVRNFKKGRMGCRQYGLVCRRVPVVRT